MINLDIDALQAAVAGIDPDSFARAAAQLGRSPSSAPLPMPTPPGFYPSPCHPTRRIGRKCCGRSQTSGEL
jgi:hypothetical protein